MEENKAGKCHRKATRLIFKTNQAHQIIKELTGCSRRPLWFIIINQTFRWIEIVIKEFHSQRHRQTKQLRWQTTSPCKVEQYFKTRIRSFASYKICDPKLSETSRNVWPFQKCCFLCVGHRGTLAFLICCRSNMDIYHPIIHSMIPFCLSVILPSILDHLLDVHDVY